MTTRSALGSCRSLDRLGSGRTDPEERPRSRRRPGRRSLSGSLAGDKILDAADIGGSFKLEPLVLREFLARIGVEPPKTRDEKAFCRSSRYRRAFPTRRKAMRLTQLDVQLDDSQLRGSLALTNPETLASEFDLNVDRINLDRYRAPEAVETSDRSRTVPGRSDAERIADNGAPGAEYEGQLQHRQRHVRRDVHDELEIGGQCPRGYRASVADQGESVRRAVFGRYHL